MAFKKSKSNSKFVKVVGRVAWAMLYWPDEFRGRSFYKINFYPDDEGMQEIKSLHLMNKWKVDDGAKSGVDGDYITFKRYTKQDTKNGPMYFAPPGVYDKDSNPIITYKHDKKGRPVFDEDGDPIPNQDDPDLPLIGNGSTVELKLEVYKGKDGNGCRLDSVRIIDLIEYVPEEEEEEETPPQKPERKTRAKKEVVDW